MRFPRFTKPAAPVQREKLPAVPVYISIGSNGAVTVQLTGQTDREVEAASGFLDCLRPSIERLEKAAIQAAKN